MWFYVNDILHSGILDILQQSYSKTRDSFATKSPAFAALEKFSRLLISGNL